MCDNQNSRNNMETEDEIIKKSKRIEVDAESDDEGRIPVGEALFVELCFAWIETHGSEILEKVLARRVVKPKMKRENAGVELC